jgi:hypothetical protein
MIHASRNANRFGEGQSAALANIDIAALHPSA